MNCNILSLGRNVRRTESELFKHINSKSSDIEIAHERYDSMFRNGNYEYSFEEFLKEKGYAAEYEELTEPLTEHYDEWAEYLNLKSNFTNSLITPANHILTKKETSELYEGFVYSIYKILEDKNINISQFALENDLEFTEEILDEIVEDVISFIEESRDEEDVYEEEEIERINYALTAIKAYPKLFITKMTNILKSHLNFNLEQNFEPEIARDATQYAESIERDPTRSSGNLIKFLILTLPNGDLNSMGTHKLVNFDEFFNYLYSNLADNEYSFEQTIEKLEELKAIEEIKDEKGKENYSEALDRLIDRLNFTESLKSNEEVLANATENKNNRLDLIRRSETRTQFINQFNKHKIDFIIHRMDNEGNFAQINSIVDKKVRNQMAKWNNDLSKNLSYINKNSIEVLKNQYNTVQKMLKLLNIKLPIELLTDQEVIKELELIRTFIFESKDTLKEVFTNNSVVKDRIKNLAEKSFEFDDSISHSHTNFNIEGKLVYSIGLNSYISTLSKKLNTNSGNSAMLKNALPHLFNNRVDSIIKDHIKSDDSAKLNLHIIDGIQNEKFGNKSHTSKLTHKDLITQRLISTLTKDVYNLPRTGDRKLEYAMSLSNSEGVVSFYQTKYATIQQYKRYLQDEIKLSKNPPKISNIKNNVKKSRLFGYRDSKGKFVNLTDYMGMSMKEIGKLDIQNNKKIDKFMNIFYENILEKEKQYLEKNKIALNEDFLKRLGVNLSAEEALAKYAIGTHVAGIEASKIFFGDLGYYKNPADVFKRLSMVNSTKNPLRTDEEILQILSVLNNKQVTNTIRTLTFEDEKSSLRDYLDSERKLIEDALAGDNRKEELLAYTKEGAIEEGDGFAYMTMPAYRNLMIRLGEWSVEHEIEYDRLMSGDLSYNPYAPKFTMKKLQYSGILKSNNRLIPSNRKFAVMPLHPSLIGTNSGLSQLSKEMVENDIEYSFFKSAAKVGHAIDNTGSANKLYQDGQFFKFTKNTMVDELDYSYMGDQLKIDEKDKDKIKATQKGKLILANFFENGEIKEEFLQYPELVEALKKYNEYYNKLSIKNYNKLMKTTGLQLTEEDSSLKEANERLVEFLRKKSITQNYDENELEALSYLLNQDMITLDMLLNKNKVESILLSNIKKIGIDIERRGQMMAQASNVGFEITQDIADVSDKHDLKFYRYAKDGETILPMEIVIPLPKKLVEYVKNKYGNGKLTQKALDTFNEEVRASKEFYEENLYHKDEYHQLVYEMSEYSGFRIPTQDMPSLDVAKVKYFTMPGAAGLVIVPKMIVVKTGSDFDIDKLNLHMPNINIKYDNQNKLFDDYVTQYLKDSELTKKQFLRKFSKNTFGSGVETIDYTEILSFMSGGMYNSNMTRQNYAFTKGLIDYISENGKIPTVEMKKDENSISGLENNLLQLENTIIRHPANKPRLFTPIVNTILTKIVDELRKDKKSIEFAEIFLPSTNVDMLVALLAGKAGVGQVAVHNTNHSLAQQAGLMMKVNNDYFGITDFEISKKILDKNETIKEGVNLLFNDNPELSNIGTQQQYSQYLDTIFPDSKVKDIVYHYNSSGKKFDKFDKSFIGTQSLRSQDGDQGFSFVDNKLIARAYGSFNTEIYTLPKEVWSTLDENTYKVYDKNIIKALVNPQKEDWKNQQDGWVEIMIKNPNNIHILGSKQDVEGFKNFVNTQSENVTNNLKNKENQYFENPQAGKYVKLGKIENQAGENISQILSELLTAYVDIAKDDYILELNAVQEAANTMLMMIRWGIPTNTVFYFLNQKSIKDYLFERADANAVTNNYKIKKKDYTAKVISQYNGDYSRLLSTYNQKIERGESTKEPKIDKYVQLTDSLLKSELERPTKNQVQMLDIFLDLQRQSNHFQKMIRTTSVDTAGFKSIDEMIRQEKEMQEVKDSNLFLNYDKMFELFTKEMYNTKKAALSSVKNLVISQFDMHSIVDYLNNLKNDMLATDYDKESIRRKVTTVENDLLNHLYSRKIFNINGSKSRIINFRRDFESLFKNSNGKSLPSYIKELQEDENLQDNELLKYLIPMLDVESYDTIRLDSNVKDDASLQKMRNDLFLLDSDEQIREEIKELGYPGETLSENLWYMNMMQTGIGNHPNSLNKIIPAKVNYEKVKLLVDAIRTQSSDLQLDIYTGFTMANNGFMMKNEFGSFELVNPHFYLNNYEGNVIAYYKGDGSYSLSENRYNKFNPIRTGSFDGKVVKRHTSLKRYGTSFKVIDNSITSDEEIKEC